MRNISITPPSLIAADGIRFRPSRFDQLALDAVIAGVLDASGRPFLTQETALRFALGIAARVLATGRVAEFQGTLGVIDGKAAVL